MIASRLVILVFALIPALRGGAAEELGWSAPAAVAEVVAGDRVRLADGRTVRLAGIRVPGAEPPVAELAEQARAALAGLIAAQPVRLETTGAAVDRYGEIAAQVERVDGLWLQGVLLERGLALVQTRPGETARAAAMLAVEQKARAARRGLWAKPAFAPLAAERARAGIGRFRIVSGRVVRVVPTKRFVYLNFGADWRTDFTIRLRRDDLDGRFAAAGIDPEALAGRRVEVRGYLLEAGGPLIELSHPEQMQILP